MKTITDNLTAYVNWKTIIGQFLDNLNSATKYPSIPTYHVLGDRGKLTSERIVPAEDGGSLYLSEKIDGTNVRIIILDDKHYLIGSREEILYYSKDLLYNPSQHIVQHVKFIAPEIIHSLIDNGYAEHITIVYGELYGGNIGKNADQYTIDNKQFEFRVFDIASIKMSDFVDKTPAAISAWRESGGQNFFDALTLNECSLDWYNASLAPNLGLRTESLPETIEDTYEWLKNTIVTTKAAINSKAGLKPEGVVVRNKNRSYIVKIRYEDYERTLKGKK